MFLRSVNDGFVTNTSGFSVLQDQSPRRIFLEPTNGRPQRQRKGSNNWKLPFSLSLSRQLIRSSNAVVLKLLLPDADNAVLDDADNRKDVGGGSERRRCGCYQGRDETTENATTEPTPSGNARVDVMAWVELMHWTKRTRQRAYIVRVRTERRNDDNNNNNNQATSFVRLRTSADLAPIVRVI